MKLRDCFSCDGQFVARRGQHRCRPCAQAIYAEQLSAANLVQAAFRRGEIQRGSCEVCGNPKTDGHHDDYSKPLEVRWLCRKHHRQHHAAEFRAPRLEVPIQVAS